MSTHGMVRVSCSLSEAFKLCHYPGLTRFRTDPVTPQP